MKSGLVLLAILLGVFLAVGQCGSGYSGGSGGSGGSGDKDDDYAASAKHDDSEDHEASDDDSDTKSDDHDDGKDDHDGKSEGGPDDVEAMKQSLQSQGLHVDQSSHSSEDDCAAHSYGAVHDHFGDHPCKSARRAWYEVRDDNDNKAVVAATWVEMPDQAQAKDLQHVMDFDTGNMNELSREDGPYTDTTFSGRYHRSRLDYDTVVSVQAEPVGDSEGATDVARRAIGTTAKD